jgi:hypothetical protein
MNKVCVFLVIVGMFAALGCGPDSNSDPCVVGWSRGEFSCSNEFPVACDQSEGCFATLAECKASGECTG